MGKDTGEPEQEPEPDIAPTSRDEQEPDIAPTSRDEQVEQFADELWRLIGRFRSEYDLSAAALIGTLEIVKLELYTEI